MDRKAISKSIRFEIFKRDRFTCQYCGRTVPQVILHVDHITAVISGGTDDINNLITSCADCNLGKGARSLKNMPAPLMDKTVEIQERREQINAYRALIDAERETTESEAWEIVEIFSPGAQTFDRRDFASVERFLGKLGFIEVREAAEIAVNARVSKFKRFAYFCGVCFNKLRRADDGPDQNRKT
jgi:hypothetical protein